MKRLNVLGISGSLRKASTNRGLLRWAQEQAAEGTLVDCQTQKLVGELLAALGDWHGRVRNS